MGTLGMVRQVHTFGSNAPLCRKVLYAIESQCLIHAPSGCNVIDNGIFEITSANSIFSIIGKLIARTATQETNNSIQAGACTYSRVFRKIKGEVVILQCDTVTRCSLTDDTQIRKFIQIQSSFQFDDTGYIKDDGTRLIGLFNSVAQTALNRSFVFVIICQRCHPIDFSPTATASKTAATFGTREGQYRSRMIVTDACIGFTILEDGNYFIQHFYRCRTWEDCFIIFDIQYDFIGSRVFLILRNPTLGYYSIVIYRIFSLRSRDNQRTTFIRNDILILLYSHRTAYTVLCHFQNALQGVVSYGFEYQDSCSGFVRIGIYCKCYFVCHKTASSGSCFLQLNPVVFFCYLQFPFHIRYYLTGKCTFSE